MATARSFALRTDEPRRRRTARHRRQAWRSRFRALEVVLADLKQRLCGEGRAAREGGPFAFGRRHALSAVWPLRAGRGSPENERRRRCPQSRVRTAQSSITKKQAAERR